MATKSEIIKEFKLVYEKIKIKSIDLSPHYPNLNLDELFEIFVNHSTVLERLIISMPLDLSKKIKPYFKSGSVLINSIANERILSYLFNVFKEIHASHMINIFTRIINQINLPIKLHEMNMNIAIALHFHPIDENILSDIIPTDENIINSLYSINMIDEKAHIDLITQQPNSQKKLIQYMKYCNDDDIKTYWYPLMGFKFIQFIQNLVLIHSEKI